LYPTGRGLSTGAVATATPRESVAAGLRRQGPSLEATARYLEELGRRPPSGPERERELVRRAKEGDERAKAQLVETFMPLIAGVARHYRASPAIERADLVQAGVVGLLQGLRRYDPERDVPFWGFARWYVRRNMQRVVAELSNPVVLSRHAVRELSKLRDAHRAFVEEHHREPGYHELADRTGLTADEVAHLLMATRMPLPTQAGVELDDGGTVTIERAVDELAEGEYERVLDAVEAEELASFLSRLSDRERTILRWRYGLDGEELGHEEIARRLGLSTSRVREIERHAREKLAAAARAAGAAP
jgi:RNA polymerase primary sigma factor